MTDQKLANSTQVVDYLIHRFMRVPPGAAARQKLIDFLDHELGTTDMAAARSYMEEPLRKLLEARTQLSNLLTYMDGKAKAEDLIAKVLQDPTMLQALASAPKAGE